MKKISIFIFLIYSVALHATIQSSDYLILNKDTVALFNDPLYDYFKQKGNFEIPDFKKRCCSTGCIRGYNTYWELKNDSLFLLKITSCKSEVCVLSEVNLLKMFGTPIVFATWYTGTLEIPRGKYVADCQTYEGEERIEINKGKVISKYTISYVEFIKEQKLNKVLSKNVGKLSDTLLYYLNKSMNWEKLENSGNRWCDDIYLLSYDQNGNLLDIKLLMNHTDSTKAKDIRFDNRLERYCTKRMKNVLDQLSLNYIKPHRPFKIKINLFYFDKLIIDNCSLYYDYKKGS